MWNWIRSRSPTRSFHGHATGMINSLWNIFVRIIAPQSLPQIQSQGSPRPDLDNRITTGHVRWTCTHDLRLGPSRNPLRDVPRDQSAQQPRWSSISISWAQELWESKTTHTFVPVPSVSASFRRDGVHACLAWQNTIKFKIISTYPFATTPSFLSGQWFW